jgi:hypothetical protein
MYKSAEFMRGLIARQNQAFGVHAEIWPSSGANPLP